LTEADENSLRETTGFVFYNISDWTIQRLYDTATNSQQILLTNFEDYLNGFSPNVKEIVEKFELKSKIRHLASKDVLFDVLEKFTSPDINLTPLEKRDSEAANCRHLPILVWVTFLRN
jgi:type I restriction enzyme M protein